jgi:protein-tyrosine-phosphatase
VKGPFRIAFICTGNRFRSVLASAAFASAAGDTPVAVESYGTLDLGPAAPLPGALRGAAAHGLDISANQARALSTADLRDVDLVVGFELEHLVTAIERAGAAMERSFALLELLGLLDQVPSEPADDPTRSARRRVAAAHALRRANARHLAEIRDPVDVSDADQDSIARDVCVYSRALAERLFSR